MDRRYQIFISSTFADLQEERAKVIQTIMELDCIPAGMEIFPAIDEEQFEFIKRVIDDCDYYLLIIGGRYGSISEDGISYTEKEYEYAISKGLKVIAFLHNNPDSIPVGKSESAPEIREKLQIFRNKSATNRLVKFWTRADELPGLVALSLSKTIKTYPAIGWIRGDTISNDPIIYKEMNDLRKENQELKNTIHNLINKPDSSNTNFSFLENLVNISGYFYKYDTDSNTSKSYKQGWSITISWIQLFISFSPLLIDGPKDINVRSQIAHRLASKAGPIPKDYTATINNDEYQLIKIQFKKVGFLKIEHEKTQTRLFLTDLGEEQFLINKLTQTTSSGAN